MATLARRLVAIGIAHTRMGFLNPTNTDLVRLTFRGIRRTYGVPQRRVAALTKELYNAISQFLQREDTCDFRSGAPRQLRRKRSAALWPKPSSMSARQSTDR